MKTDCAFYIGSKHEVCHDYVLAQPSMVVLSDGCSGSPLTDFGSRILCVAALNEMSEVGSTKEFITSKCILSARPIAKLLNLPVECLDATLLCAMMNEETNTLSALLYGDGCIAIKYTNGEIWLVTGTSPSDEKNSYPFYINYLYDRRKRYDAWKVKGTKKNSIHIIKPDGEITTEVESSREKTERLGPDGSAGLLIVEEFRTQIEMVNAKQDVEWIALISDGVQSFYEDVVEETSSFVKNVDYLQVVPELLKMKLFAGPFVQRRLNKFRRWCSKRNLEHGDDLSMAVLYLGE